MKARDRKPHPVRRIHEAIVMALCFAAGVHATLAANAPLANAVPSQPGSPSNATTPPGIASESREHSTGGTTALDTAAAILGLSESEAKRGLPASVTGVVTYYDPKWDTLFVQDETGGIYVFPGRSRRLELKPGQWIRVEGPTVAARPSNAIGEKSIQLLGLAPIPEPIRVTADDLVRQRHDSTWVEFEAIVRQWTCRYQRVEVVLALGGARVFADSPDHAGRHPDPRLVHARVRVRGVASKIAEQPDGPVTIRVFVPDLDHYTIIEHPPDDPFSLPRVRIPEITGSEANIQTDARRRIRARVLFATPDELVVQEKTDGMVVRILRSRPVDDPEGLADARPNPPAVGPGDMIEAVGYVSRVPSPPKLVDAFVRKAPRSEEDGNTEPRAISVGDIREGRPLHVLSELEAEFREELAPEYLGSMVLHRWLLAGEGKFFEVALPEVHGPSHELVPGTLLRLRGFIEPKPSLPGVLEGFRFRIRSDADLVVRGSPRRWLTREVINVLSFSITVTLALLGWTVLLWRESGRQRAVNRELEARILMRTAELTDANRSLEAQVSEQRRVESALLESEARTRAILEHNPEGIVVVDPETFRFVEANDAAAGLFGASRADLLQKSPAEVSPPRQPDGTASTEASISHVQSALAGGPHRFEWVHRDVDGRDFPCEVNLALLPREGRTFVIGTIADISARQRADRIRKAIYEISEAANHAEDLQELYRRIHTVVRQLMNADNLYIASHDPGTNLLSFPYYVDEMDPTPPTRPLRRGFTEYVLRTVRPLLADAKVGEELRRSGECEAIGSPAALWLGAPLATRGRPFGVLAIQEYHDPDAFGQEEKDVLGFVAEQIAIAIDRRRAVDDLRASEARLRESEERFSKAFHNCQGALAIVSLEDGRYLDVNEGFVRTYGYSREDSLGKTSLDLGLWQEPSHRARLFERLRESGSFRNEETVMRRRDGQILTTVESADVIEIGGQQCVIVFALDITDRKRAETELFHALRRERELSQLKTSFVSLVSHEFRTPLEIILSSGEILERYHERLGIEQRTRQLRAITGSVRRMAHMMNEVLLLGRFDAGRMEFQPAPVDLRVFCQRVAEDIAAATDRRCPIHLDFHDDLSEAAGDEALLGHTFTNLLSNAVKYSPADRLVRFEVRRDRHEAVFTVVDQGVGIPESDRDRLFSAFHRGSNVGQAPGSGLGLVIVRRCTELHRGSLRFTSAEGTGTTFEVRIPMWPASTTESPSPLSTAVESA